MLPHTHNWRLLFPLKKSIDWFLHNGNFNELSSSCIKRFWWWFFLESPYIYIIFPIETSFQSKKTDPITLLDIPVWKLYCKKITQLYFWVSQFEIGLVLVSKQFKYILNVFFFFFEFSSRIVESGQQFHLKLIEWFKMQNQYKSFADWC